MTIKDASESGVSLALEQLIKEHHEGFIQLGPGVDDSMYEARATQFNLLEYFMNAFVWFAYGYTDSGYQRMLQNIIGFSNKFI